MNPGRALGEAEHAKNNLPDVLARWRLRDGTERQRARTDQSFCVPQAEIAGNGFDLSINRYKEVVHDAIEQGNCMSESRLVIKARAQSDKRAATWLYNKRRTQGRLRS